MSSSIMLEPGGSASTEIAPARAITDTVELRWFALGPIPLEVRSWFGGGAVEERCDTYRFDGRDDVGLKLRSGHLLELKVRRSVEDDLELSDGLVGRLEGWRRWSPADGLVELGPDDRWGDVTKTITKRRFLALGVEAVVDPSLSGEFCDVELTEIAVAGTCWWSFALAAYGAPSTPAQALRATFEAVAATPPPPELTTAFGEPRGYPRWLADCVPAATAPALLDSAATG